MIATHSVKINGKWYKAGDNLPAFNSASEPKIQVTENKPNAYTKTEINRMPITELKALASKVGISGYDSMTGAELKKSLIKAFEL